MPMLKNNHCAEADAALPTEARAMLDRYRAAAGVGLPTLDSLDATLLRARARHLGIVRPDGQGRYRFLHCGARLAAALSEAEYLFPAHSDALVPETPVVQALRQADERQGPIIARLAAGADEIERRWLLLCLPLRDEDGSALFLVQACQSAGREATLLAGLDAMSDAVLVAAAERNPDGKPIDGTIIAANARAVALFGAPPRPIAGQKLGEVFPRSGGNGIFERQMEVIESGEPKTFEILKSLPEGPCWYRISLARFSDGIVITCVDITTFKRIAQDIAAHRAKAETERQRLEEDVALRERTDDLTRLLNRRTFLEAGEACLLSLSAESRGAALLAIEIDHLKRWTGRHGHAAAELILRCVAEIIRAHGKPGDLAATLGGDEFAVLLADAAPDTALAIAEAIRKTVEDLEIEIEETRLRITVSIGVALRRRRATFNDTLARALRALHTATRTGHNRVATELDLGADAA